MYNYLNTEEVYFGAANGFSGFRSNFGKIFSPRTLDKLFIIKGGPGTGKSTLMRKIKERYSQECDITTILCSSDPDSIDGIIIKKGGITVGIADGTSPHTIEPEFPGATEEIINLGDGFDFKALRENKTEIIKLSDSKKTNYKSAYASLKLAGYVYDYISSCFAKTRYNNEAEEYIENLIQDEDITDRKYSKSNFLLSAFCKNGYKCIEKSWHDKKVIKIKSEGIYEYILMSKISERLHERCISYRIFPSAFSVDLPDIIKTDRCVYKITFGTDCTLDSGLFIRQNYEYERLKSAFKSFIESSQLSLIKASEDHFKLESIYTTYTAFEKNEEKLSLILNKIDRLFDK